MTTVAEQGFEIDGHENRAWSEWFRIAEPFYGSISETERIHLRSAFHVGYRAGSHPADAAHTADCHVAQGWCDCGSGDTNG